MEGWLSGIFALFGFTDMYFNDCPTGCFRQSDADARWHYQIGAVEFNENIVGKEILLGYDLDRKYGQLQPTIAASLTDSQDFWFGAGLKWTTEHLYDSQFYFEAYSMPGIYLAGDGPEIGGFIQFRGSIGVGYEFENGIRASLAFDHRSNAHIWKINSGLETYNLRVSIPVE